MDADRGAGPATVARYRARAEAAVEAARHEWRVSGGTEVRDLVRGAMEALAVEAGRDLRQVLFQLRLAIDGGAYETAEGRAELLAAIERAGAIVRTHLDREAVQRSLIALTPSRFDLASALAAHLEDHHLVGRHGVRVDASPVWVEGDRLKLLDVLGHVVADAALHASARQTVTVRTGPGDDGTAHVQIVVSPSSTSPEGLLRALDAPLAMDVAAIDVPYVRAVIERHGGSMLIETTPEGGVGYGFRLPVVDSSEAGP